MFESASSASTVSYVQLSGATGTDVNYTSTKALYADAAVASGWTHHEVVYTPTAYTKWARCPFRTRAARWAGPPTIEAFDNVEVAKQLGAGSKASSITADRLSVSTLSLDQREHRHDHGGAMSIAVGSSTCRATAPPTSACSTPATVQTTNLSVYGIAGGGNQCVCVAPSGTLYGSAGGCWRS